MTKRDELIALADLRRANVTRQKEWDALDQLTLAYRGNELAGEVGEACNVIKKLERERLGIKGSRDTVEHLAEELADIIICTDLIAMQAGIDLDAAVIAKFNASSEKVGLKTRLASSDGGAKVRELEWHEITAARSDEDPSHEPTGDYEAVSSIGVYFIEMYFGSDSYGWSVSLNSDLNSDFVSDHDDPCAAKAAAQADYERRILSALEAPAAGDGEPAFPTWDAEDEAYELGKLDGYESAIQDLDIATGGDGEFKGSTIPGGTVDVPAMKARIVGRTTTAPPADAAMREALGAQLPLSKVILDAFQVGFKNQLRDRHRNRYSGAPLMSAEEAGLRAMLKALTAPGATTKSDGVEHYVTSGYSDYTPVAVRGSTTVPMLVDDPNSASGKRVEYQRPSEPSSTRSEVTVEIGELVDDLLAVVAEVRCQNWKNGGAHIYDDEDAARKVASALLGQFEITRRK